MVFLYHGQEDRVKKYKFLLYRSSKKLRHDGRKSSSLQKTWLPLCKKVAVERDLYTGKASCNYALSLSISLCLSVITIKHNIVN